MAYLVRKIFSKSSLGIWVRLAKPNTHNADQKYERKASQAASTDHGTVRFIDIHLMHEWISDLKPHKAGGHDNIYNEHINWEALT